MIASMINHLETDPRMKSATARRKVRSKMTKPLGLDIPLTPRVFIRTIKRKILFKMSLKRSLKELLRNLN